MKNLKLNKFKKHVLLKIEKDETMIEFALKRRTIND